MLLNSNAYISMFSEEESLLFGRQENPRKEEKKDTVNQSYQGTGHLLAEASECLYAFKVGYVVSACFL